MAPVAHQWRCRCSVVSQAPKGPPGLSFSSTSSERPHHDLEGPPAGEGGSHHTGWRPWPLGGPSVTVWKGSPRPGLGRCAPHGPAAASASACGSRPARLGLARQGPAAQSPWRTCWARTAAVRALGSHQQPPIPVPHPSILGASLHGLHCSGGCMSLGRTQVVEEWLIRGDRAGESMHVFSYWECRTFRVSH